MKLSQVDRNKLLPLLLQLSSAIEDLLVTGLTTASETTVQTLNVSFQEASRMGLLRLGTTLRAVNEEVARFTKNQAGFSRRRLSFFLNRSWVLTRALKNAIENNKDDVFERLMLTPSASPVDSIDLVTIGVVKRSATSFVAFDFRLRAVTEHGAIKKGDKLVLSCVFPKTPGVEIPAEGYLHLPQKQKHKGTTFLEGKQIRIEKVNVSPDPTGCRRLILTDASTVVPTETFAGNSWSELQSLLTWDQRAALERVRSHQPGPFDLEIEMQEEVFFDDWLVGEPSESSEDNQVVYPVMTSLLPCEVTVVRSPDTENVIEQLNALVNKKGKGTLYGLLHYERCKMVLQPLTIFKSDGKNVVVKHLMISDKKIDPKALLATLKF